MAEVAGSVGLHIKKGKSKTLKINTPNLEPITLGNEAFEEVTNFTYLGSVVDDEGGSDRDIKIRIDKARAAFKRLNNVWNCAKIKKTTKIRMF